MAYKTSMNRPVNSVDSALFRFSFRCRLDLWSSPALRGARSNWTYVGPMFTTNVTVNGANKIQREFVTSGYIGFGEQGSTRVVTQNNGGPTCK
jgi:hypothetical protein